MQLQAAWRHPPQRSSLLCHGKTCTEALLTLQRTRPPYACPCCSPCTCTRMVCMCVCVCMCMCCVYCVCREGGGGKNSKGHKCQGSVVSKEDPAPPRCMHSRGKHRGYRRTRSRSLPSITSSKSRREHSLHHTRKPQDAQGVCVVCATRRLPTRCHARHGWQAGSPRHSMTRCVTVGRTSQRKSINHSTHMVSRRPFTSAASS